MPSRLIGMEVDVRVYADHIEVYYKGHLVESMERIHGAGEAHIDYRHIIGSLVRKPGAFAHYASCVMTRPGELFYRRLAALGILCDLGRVLKQVPISQGLSAAFVSAGWPVLGRETPENQAEAPQARPPGLVGKSRLTWNASYIISRCFCSLHTSPILRARA